MNPFHYAFKILDIESTRLFYINILGCKEGRSTEHWIDFNFFGHQLSAHISEEIPALDYCGQVDGVAVPIPHFGAIIPTDKFQNLREKLEISGVEFVIKPIIRYKGKPGEQWSMFFLDPSGNPIELKAFKNETEIFQDE